MHIPYFRLALVSFLIKSTAASAQTIVGQLLDKETRRPVHGTPVELRDSTRVVSSDKSADDGAYYLIAPRAGTYQLRIGTPGPWQVVIDSIPLAADETVQRSFLIPVVPVYFDFQVDRPAQQIPGTGALRYPVELRDAHIQGEVLVQFVVDSTGHAVVETLKALRATHQGFVEAVRQALATLRFYPAQRGTRPVAQLVQQPFTFSLTP